MKVQQTSEFKRILNADTHNIRITNADGINETLLVSPDFTGEPIRHTLHTQKRDLISQTS